MTRFAVIAAASTCLALVAGAGEAVSFETVDANGDGFIAEGEFVDWKTAEGTVSPTDALLKFIEIDTDASGMISETEMEAVLSPADEAEDDPEMDDTEME